jgi:hypothetical protein
MLIPLTRKKFEELVPITATGEQYRFYWGKPADLLQRVLISVFAIIGVFALQWVLDIFFKEDGWKFLLLPLGLWAGLYWLWGPVLSAALRNRELRKYKYSGFWQGEVYEVFVTEELVGTSEKVDARGELVVSENRERCVNLEVGDETGFSTLVKAPLLKDHRVIRPGDRVEMLVLSNREDLSRILKFSDLYLSESELWVSAYPALRRDVFVEVSRRFESDRRRR